MQDDADKMIEGDTVRYQLRYHIIPGEHAVQDARNLACFCREHGIQEVALFVAAAEWNAGLFSAKDERRWFDHIKAVKPIFEAAGIAVSLNIWLTVGQTDNGQSFPEDRPFKPMVSPYGQKAKACASFADPHWQDYVARLYGRFAQLDLRVLWVEDDFRYHNHSPLKWGGGFEPGVLKRFSKKVGCKVTRAQVVRNILKPGKPHPWRALWMANWHELQMEVARKLASVVAQGGRGQSMLGLMSSCPSVHSVEGRQWQQLFDAFTTNGRVAHRPNFAPYSDVVGTAEARGMMTLDLQRTLRPSYCEVAPEIENYPFTRWNKSHTQTWAEMALCLMYGSDALLLNLFSFAGSPLKEQPHGEVSELLCKSRPALEWITHRFSKDMQTRGVGIPWRQNAQAHVHTRIGESLDELDATSFSPGYFLLPYGIPVSAKLQKVNAVFGNLAWAFSDEKIDELLTGGLLLDGISAQILYQRGFGAQIGVDIEALVDRHHHPFSVEMTATSVCGVRKGYYFQLWGLHSLAIVHPRTQAKEWTTILTPRHERVGAGLTIFKNKRGGRVATYAAVALCPVAPAHQQQAILQKVLSVLSGGRFGSVFVTGGANLLPLHFESGNKRLIVVFNGSPDGARPVVRCNVIRDAPRAATILTPLGKPETISLDTTENKGIVVLTCQREVPYFGYLVLEW